MKILNNSNYKLKAHKSTEDLIYGLILNGCFSTNSSLSIAILRIKTIYLSMFISVTKKTGSLDFWYVAQSNKRWKKNYWRC